MKVRPSAEVLEGRQLLSGDLHGAGSRIGDVSAMAIHHTIAAQGRPVTPSLAAPYDPLTLATFTSTKPGAAIGDFTAQVDWGDGSFGAASIANSPGSGGFAVYGSHQYNHVGQFTFHITIKDTAGDTAAATQTASVVATLAHGLNLSDYFTSAGVNVPNDNTTLAFLTSVGPNAAAGDFSGTIDWGDGTTTAALVKTSPYGGFTVSGRHTYSQAGTFIGHIQLSDKMGHSGAASQIVNVRVEALTAHGVAVQSFPGVTSGDVRVATFSDAAYGLPAGDYSATIDWGDGTTSIGTIEPNFFAVPAGVKSSSAVGPLPQPDPFSVVGRHTYATDGTYTIRVSIASLGGAHADATSTATVSEIIATLGSITATTGIAPHYTRSLGSFTVPVVNAQAGDYTAIVDWGDGSTSHAQIGQPYPLYAPTPNDPHGTIVTLSGNHIYDHAGTYTVRVTVTDKSNHSGIATTTATVQDEILTGQPILFYETAGAANGSTVVAGFSDSSFDLTQGDYRATIDWGDGSPLAVGNVSYVIRYFPLSVGENSLPSRTSVVEPGSASIVLPPQFNVGGEHTYATPGKYVIHVTVTSPNGTAIKIASGVDVIPKSPDTLTPSPILFFGYQGVALGSGPIPLASFADSNPNAVPGDFTATIDWGDGSAPTQGQVVATVLNRNASISMGHQIFNPVGQPPSPASVFEVLGNHTYAAAGKYAVRVILTNRQGVKATAGSGVEIVSTSRQETLTPSPSPIRTTAGRTPPPLLQVATFTDSDPTARPEDFAVTIDWGDGTAATPGTVQPFLTASSLAPGSPSAGGFSVLGTHTYASEGDRTVHVTIRRLGGASTAVNTTAHVAAANPNNGDGPVELRKLIALFRQVVDANRRAQHPVRHPRGPAPTFSRARAHLVTNHVPSVKASITIAGRVNHVRPV